MRKLLLSTLAICMIILASCKKDSDNGGNTPGGGSQTVEVRTSRFLLNDVTYEEASPDGGQTWIVVETEDQYQCNVDFTWNDKLLSNIKQDHVSFEFGDEYHFCVNYDFRYDNNKLSRVIIEMSEDGEIYTVRVDVEYDGGNMSGLTVYEDGEIADVNHLEYSNGKLSLITDEYDDFVFNWNGDNLSEFLNDNWCEKYISYDDNKNPFYGTDVFTSYLILDYYGFEGDMRFLSKNNCTDIDTPEGPMTIEYEYNSNGYPTKAVNEWTYNIHNEYGYSTRTRSEMIYTYEYLD